MHGFPPSPPWQAGGHPVLVPLRPHWRQAPDHDRRPARRDRRVPVRRPARRPPVAQAADQAAGAGGVLRPGPGLPGRRPRGTRGRQAALPARHGRRGKFAALAARHHEVTPRAGPLGAVPVRPQVTVPTLRALLAPGNLADAHPPTVTWRSAVVRVPRPPPTIPPGAGSGLAGAAVSVPADRRPV